MIKPQKVLKSKSPINKRFLFVFSLLLLAGFLLRVYFAPQFIKESGDIRLFADWGEKYWEYGSKDFYYINDWYYAAPNYPPIITLIYAGAYWLFDHKYVLPQLHNLVKIPPAAFIIYFYDHGYYLLLKLPGILADLGITLLIYKLVLNLSKSKNRSMIAASFYLFNPISIFLSGVWGQTDSLIALFGMLSFIALLRGKLWLSLPLIFTSLYIKPNWGVFIPLYVYLLYLKKPKWKQMVVGVILTLAIYFATTEAFAKDNVINFTVWLFRTRVIPTASLMNKASVSAFNFHTIFFGIDRAPDTVEILGTPVKTIGFLIFVIFNLMTFSFIKKAKTSLFSVIAGLFIIGFSSYLFLTNMLERYFFSSFVPMIVISFVKPKTFLYMIFINFVIFSNLIYSFFRRTSDEIGHIFINYNFIVLRTLSFINLLFYLLITRFVLQRTRFKNA